MMQRRDKEYVHGQAAIEVAKLKGIFLNDDVTWDVEMEKDIDVASNDVDEKLNFWKNELQESSGVVDETSLEWKGSEVMRDPEVVAMSDLWNPENGERNENIDVDDPNRITPADITNLNDDQRRVYEIVDWHLQESIDGKVPPQLLMFIPGEGGVGKSKLIQNMTRSFENHGRSHWCVKGAYTGIAALLIDGKTLHVLGGIPVRGGKQSAQTLKRLHTFWKDKRYLIIDKVSMLSCGFFAKLSRIISTTLESEEDKIFGGLNVILVGDFHQFPPVVARLSAPLYWPVDSRNDLEDDILGRKIFEQFTTIVQLKKQVRVQDDVWHDVLQHVRHGNCRQEQIDVIKRLVIDDPRCPPTDFSSLPWKNARLVMPRHAIRIQWNSAAIRKYCAQSSQ